MNTENSQAYDYQVELQPLITADGLKSPAFATVRTDTKQVLGVVSDRYDVLQNRDLIHTIESEFKNAGLEYKERNLFVRNGGARFSARYDFSINRAVPVVGDILGLRLTASNSFDKSGSIITDIGFRRLVCLNGLVISKTEFTVSKRHYRIEDVIASLGADLHNAIPIFNLAVDSFATLANVKVTQVEGHRLIDLLTEEEVIPKRITDLVQEVWKNPTYEADKSRNLWNLYNAGTQVLTHIVEKDRFDTAQRVTRNLSDRLFDIAAKPESIPQLTLAV
jgi:hypothetical protein